MDDLLLYLELILFAFLVNVVPALAPPTWIILAMFKNHNPELSILAIAVLGVVGTILGRYVMYLYCRALGRHVPQKYGKNLTYVSRLLGKHKVGLFFGSLLYALSPLPSNFLFISFGVSSLEIFPVLGGFAAGRLISYTALTYATHRVFLFLEALGLANLRLVIDVLGLVGGISVIFIDWESMAAKFNFHPVNKNEKQ